jgi:hypothetical protein
LAICLVHRLPVRMPLEMLLIAGNSGRDRVGPAGPLKPR